MCNCASDQPGKATVHRTGQLDRRGLLRMSGAAGLAAGLSTVAPSAGATAPASTAARQPRRRTGLRLVLLGTNGGPPPGDRMGISSALVVDGATYVVDCGRGATSQYYRAGLKFADLRNIFLTHLHADHVVDYYDFFLLPILRDQSGDSLAGPVGVFGPGPAGALPPKFGGGEAETVHPEDPTPGTAAMTEYCHNAFAYSSNVFMRDSGMRDIREFPVVQEIQVPDVGARALGNRAPAMDPFVVMEDDRVRVTAVLVPHGPAFPSFAYRFDTDYGSVTFSGDTTYTENLPRLAQDTDILVHEAIRVEGANLPAALLDHLLESHVVVDRVGPIAQAAQAKRLVLSHIGDLSTPTLDSRLWQRAAQRGYDGPVTIGRDLAEFTVRRRGHGR